MTSDGRDAEHLRLLTIGHYVGAGLGVVGIAFLGLHFLFFTTVFKSIPPQSQSGRPPFDMKQVLAVVPWFYGAAGALLLTNSVLNVVSARCIANRRARTFSIAVAGLNCMHVPLGAALGVLTILVLTRESVRAAYRR
jgi:hypothetical protein